MALEDEVAAITRQETELAFQRFDEDTAWQLGSMIREEALGQRWPIIVDVRFFHLPLFFAALPGAAPDNLEWARRKRNVVERFQRSSLGVGRTLARDGKTLTTRYALDPADYAAHGGGFPLRLEGTGVIGCVVVSGLPQEDDHMLIVRSLCILLGRDSASMALRT